jgi:hypothetical protein
MNDKRRNGIVDDLLRKRPNGPRGVNLTYTEEEKYDYDSGPGRLRVIQIPSEPGFGYPPDVLFQLGLLDEFAVTRYVLDRFFPGTHHAGELGRKKSTVTRRANRLWARIKEHVKTVQNAGGPGIYIVKRSRYSEEALAYVHALNTKEAETLADMFLPKAEPGRTLGIQFVEFGNADKLRAYNNEIRQKNDRMIETWKRQIANFETKMEKVHNLHTTLEILENHQIALED